MTNILFLILGACVPTVFCSFLNLITIILDNLSEFFAIKIGAKIVKIKKECQDELNEEEKQSLIGFAYNGISDEEEELDEND